MSGTHTRLLRGLHFVFRKQERTALFRETGEDCIVLGNRRGLHFLGNRRGLHFFVGNREGVQINGGAMRDNMVPAPSSSIPHSSLLLPHHPDPCPNPLCAFIRLDTRQGSPRTCF
jgi:hypothetical protein